MGAKMPPWGLAALLTIGMITAATPVAAQYYYPPSDPCAPPGPGLNGLFNQLNAAQRAQACRQARDAAMRQQQINAAAAQAREAEADRVAARERVEMEAQARAIAAAQTAAEASPDNFCRQPDTARNLIRQYNGMDWLGYTPRQVVDIEHLVTIKKDEGSGILFCHGIWVQTNGSKIEGTLTMRPNVAGDVIVTWNQAHWQPPAVSTGPTQQPATLIPPNVSYAFLQGLADRGAWERWFSFTTGDYRNGALYWSAQRSLAYPGSCTAMGGDATAGCLAAQARLGASDIRRKREPDYRQGWNSYQTQ